MYNNIHYSYAREGQQMVEREREREIAKRINILIISTPGAQFFPV